MPGGWANSKGGQNVLYIVHRKDNVFSFSVVNSSGEGMKYHPYTLDYSPDVQYKLVLTVDDIPMPRLLDSAFWFMLLRMQIWPNDNHNATLLYETLIPFLSGKPLVRAHWHARAHTSPRFPRSLCFVIERHALRERGGGAVEVCGGRQQLQRRSERVRRQQRPVRDRYAGPGR